MRKKKDWIPLDFKRMQLDEMQSRSEKFLRLMEKRRSCRDFSNDTVPDIVIENALKAAALAPSGANKQPWLFCVVKSPEIKKKIRIAAEKEEKINYEKRFSQQMKDGLAQLKIDRSKNFLEEAPVLIVVFKEKYRIIDSELVKNYFVSESCGIAVGMLITALYNAGLVTLPYTPSPMNFLNKILSRPKNESPFVILPVGFPKKDAMMPDIKRKSPDEVIKIY